MVFLEMALQYHLYLNKNSHSATEVRPIIFSQKKTSPGLRLLNDEENCQVFNSGHVVEIVVIYEQPATNKPGPAT